MFKKIENKPYTRKGDIFDVSINNSGHLYLSSAFMRDIKNDIRKIDVYLDSHLNELFFCENNTTGLFKRIPIQSWNKQRVFTIMSIIKKFNLYKYRGNRYNVIAAIINGESGFKIELDNNINK